MVAHGDTSLTRPSGVSCRLWEVDYDGTAPRCRGVLTEPVPPSSMRRCAVHAAETHVIIFIAYWGSGPFLLESCEGQ